MERESLNRVVEQQLSDGTWRTVTTRDTEVGCQNFINANGPGYDQPLRVAKIPEDEPRLGDTAMRRRRPVMVTIVEIKRHIKSEDIAYLFVQFPDGKRRGIVMVEWLTNYRGWLRRGEGGREMVDLPNTD